MSEGDSLRDGQYRDSSNLSARCALHARFSVNPYRWQHWVFDRLRLPDGARLLELGCGTGALWRENAERIPAGWAVTLSDFSPGMLEDAKQALADSAARFRFEVVDAQSIPFPDGSFDGVIANHMLYHVPDVNLALSEIRRILRPGGRCYAATNGAGHLAELKELARDFGLPFALPEFCLERFSLNTGAKVLARYLDQVALHQYEDALRVTEAEPIVDYLLSAGEGEGRGQHADLLDFVQARLDREGAIHIRKEAGLFAARRSD